VCGGEEVAVLNHDHVGVLPDDTPSPIRPRSTRRRLSLTLARHAFADFSFVVFSDFAKRSPWTRKTTRYQPFPDARCAMGEFFPLKEKGSIDTKAIQTRSPPQMNPKRHWGFVFSCQLEFGKERFTLEKP
jgi:hypothetical protein